MKSEDLENLNNLFETLKKTKFPSFCGNDELDEWIENLTEIDALIAGLACSLLGGERNILNQIPEINPLKEAFYNLISKRKVDYEILEQCQNYLNLLLRLHKQLSALAK